MKKLTISIVLCTYNGEKYIEEQLDSIINQTRKADEIIIIDDNSTDKTFDILNKYKKKSASINIFKNNNNVGYIANFSKGISKVRKDIIVLCDQDDIWDVKKLEVIERYFIYNSNTIAVFSDGYIIDENSKCTGTTLWDTVGYSCNYEAENERILKTMLKQDIVTGATLAFRSLMIEYIIPIDLRYVHDTWIAMIAATQGKLGVIPSKLINYRLHNNQSVGLKKQTFFSKIFKLYKNDKKLYLENVYKCNSILDRLYKYNLISISEIGLLIEKRDYFEKRASYSNSFFKRLIQVSHRLIKGDYFRYSPNGFSSALKDLINIQNRG